MRVASWGHWSAVCIGPCCVVCAAVTCVGQDGSLAFREGMGWGLVETHLQHHGRGTHSSLDMKLTGARGQVRSWGGEEGVDVSKGLKRRVRPKPGPTAPFLRLLQGIGCHRGMKARPGKGLTIRWPGHMCACTCTHTHTHPIIVIKDGNSAA